MGTAAPPETRRGSPAVVELIGAPGAGKSTLLPAVLEACREEGLRPFTVVEGARRSAARTAPGRAINALLPAERRRAAMWAVFLGFRAVNAAAFAVRYAPLARYVAGSAGRRPAAAEARRRKVVRWYVRLAGSYRFLRSHAGGDEALVLDEGFAHRAVQLHASSVEVPDAARIERYVTLIPRPDVLVHVRAPVDVCVARVRSRGAWDRFRDRDPLELDRFVASAHRATELVVDAARRRGWRVLEIDAGGADPARTAREATSALSTELGSLRRGGSR